MAIHTLTAQTTNIPDPIFEQMLITAGIDSDGVVNAQISTIDALSVTSLVIASPNPGPGQYITDLTGLEAFTNLESLIVNNTMVEELDVSTMSGLKYLNCVDNALTNLDVSNNPLLEHLNITSGGDVYPFNTFTQIDLSNNPNINELIAWGEIEYINLKNGNNNPDMKLQIASNFTFGPPADFTPTHTCIEIDDENAALNNQLPYSEWDILDSYHTYNFTETCLMKTERFGKDDVVLYPNPVADVLYISAANGTSIYKAILYDLAGRVVREYNSVANGNITVSGLAGGIYIIEIFSGNKAQTKKIVIE